MERSVASPEISVIVPCYNEGAILDESVALAVREIGRVAPSFEIILCNDGSTDDTGAVMDRLAERYSNVRSVGYSQNRGAGYAFRRGLTNATGKVVMHMDADLAMHPRDVCNTLLPLLADHEIAIASRYRGVKAQYPLRRRIPSHIYRAIYRFLLGLPIYDAMSGFFAFRREVLDRIEPLRSDGFEVYLELFLKAKLCGCRIAEVGVEFRHQTESGEVSVLAYAPKQLMNTLRIWRTVRLASAASRAAARPD